MPAATLSAEVEAALGYEACVFRHFFEEASVGMALAGPDRRFVKVNRAFCQMLGYEEHELVGRTYADFTYRDDLPDSDEHARRLYARLTARDRYQKRFVHKDGSVMWAQVTLTSMTYESGRSTYALAIVEDITERKRAEQERHLALQELSRAQRRLQELFDGAPDMYFVVAEDGTVLRVNRPGARLLGYDVAELEGATVWRVVHPDDLVAVRRQIAELFRSRPPTSELEFRKVRRDGTILWVQERVSFVAGSERAPAILVVCRDVTERKRAEQLLRESEERYRVLSTRLLRVRDEERRNLARELHDETGQTLTSLLVGLRTIHEARTVRQARAMAERLRRIASEAVDDLGRITRGLHPSVLDDHGLEAALRRLASDVSELHRISIVVEDPCLGGGRFPPQVEATLYRITQEALANAVRHAHAQHVLVSARCGDGEIVLRVQDDGPGLDPAAPGTDGHLGLLGMRERAALASGTVAIESRPGEGTTIVARIPLDHA